MRTLPFLFFAAALAFSGADAFAEAPFANTQLRADIAGQATAPPAAEIRIAYVNIDRVVALSAERKGGYHQAR